MFTVNKTKEENVRTLYTGIAAVNVIALNPNKEQRNKIFGTESEFIPEYLTQTTVKEKGIEKTVPQMRINFVVKTDLRKKLDGKTYAFDCNNGIDSIFNINFYLSKAYRYTRDNTKLQVIDKYGRTGWVTEEQLANHEIPINSNGLPAQLDKDYRPCYLNEEYLTKFLCTLFNIDSPTVFDRNAGCYVLRPANELDKCLARLDKIEEIFNGNLTTLNSYVEAAKINPNTIKIFMGVNKKENGNTTQVYWDNSFVNSAVSNYKPIINDITEQQSKGRKTRDIYDLNNVTLHEYIPVNESDATVESGDSAELDSLPFESAF